MIPEFLYWLFVKALTARDEGRLKMSKILFGILEKKMDFIDKLNRKRAKRNQ